jgi:DNA polymerase-3 subunit gamma/tau
MADTPFVSLYRRFRPGRFGEIRGQDHVVRALQSAVRDDRVSHAYLFSGPRGTGKTSSARILAKALNCEKAVDGEPCSTCLSCTEITQGTSLNVHELDAASNNGVDAMRDLVAHAGLGTPGRWKVYIVDEVHMLSAAAANALLKTLEEPPGHVVFVLATTDPQKVPPTIRSRTQHLEFRLLGAETLVHLLESVRSEAGLEVDEEAIVAAVRRGRGSARDALSALDQVAASGTSESARPELSVLVDELSQGDVSRVLVTVHELLVAGWGPQQLATELVDDLRQVFLAALAPELCAVSGPARERFTALAEAMRLPQIVRCIEVVGRSIIDMRDAPDAQVVLEIAMVRATRPDLDSGIEALSDRVSNLERLQASGGPAPRPVPPAQSSVPAGPTDPAPSPIDVGHRPSLGAVRRRQEGGPPDGVTGPGPEGAGEPGTPPSASPPAGATADPTAPTVDRDSLTEAWGDGILRSLPGLTRALYSAGRFVTVDERGAQFALPDAPHRDRCTELLPQVEAALAQHFGSPVKLVLVLDDARSGAARPGRDVASGSGPGRDDTVDVSEEEEQSALLEASEGVTDQASEAEARLLQAFPGASEVIS